MFGRIKDSIVYTWNDNDKLRHWFKALTCPCLCCCFCFRWCMSAPFGGERMRRRRPNRRQIKLSEINRNRRARELNNRNRSVSVDSSWKSPEAKEQQQSPFFSELPTEIRLKIYEMVLCNDNGLKIVDNNSRFSDYYRILATNLCSINLLCTCKRLYREAVPTLYSSNNFHFGYISALVIFSQSVLPQRLQQIRSITLRDLTFANQHGILQESYRSPSQKLYNISDLLAIIHLMQGLRIITLHYVLADSDYERHLHNRPFPLVDKFPTESLQPSCRVEYKIESLSDFMSRGNGHAGDIQKSQIMETWWRLGNN